MLTQIESDPSSFNFVEDLHISNFKKIQPAQSTAHILSKLKRGKPGHISKNIYPITYTDKMAAIRFISMCSIVWGHCMLGWQPSPASSYGLQVVQAFFLQLGKIGTINFFIISGFFLNDKIHNYTVVNYIRHRFFPLILPWFVFLALFVIVELFHVLSIEELVHGNMSQTLRRALVLAQSFVFHSAYWFIPISIFSAIVLIAFKRFLNKTWFGILLGCVALFYCINLYYGWVNANHAQSAFGYIFFMWLGLQLKAKKVKIKPIINALSWRILIPAAMVLFIIASREGLNLTRIGSPDAFASNRLSNAVLSTVIFLLLLKAANIKWIGYLNPRKYCFGIYLVHCIVIAQITPLIEKFFLRQYFINFIPFAILLRLCFFLLVICLGYVVVVMVSKTKLKFVLGIRQ